jgi:NitT/TauT family transport system permease protein
MNPILKFVLPVIGGFILLGGWLSIRYFNLEDEWVLPWPQDVLAAGQEEGENLTSAAIQTTQSAIIGFVAAVLLGYLFSLMMALSRWFEKMWYPWVIVLKMIPVIVLAPIFALWFGNGLLSIVIITFLISFFPIVANTAMGLTSTDRNMLDLFRTLNASKAQELYFLRVPFSMPYFLTGLKVAAVLAPIGAIVGDLLVGQADGGRGGLGFWTLTYSAQLKTSALFATAGVACLLGLVFVSAVNLLHWWLLHDWHESAVKSDT